MTGILEMFAELNGYERYEVDLQQWAAINLAVRRARRPLKPRRERPHGTKSRYTGGCRCEACREAVAQYQRVRYASKRLAAGRAPDARGRKRKYQEAA